MNNIFAITKKELKTYFLSPIAYVVFTLFLLIAGFFFATYLINTQQATLRPTFYNLIITLLFFMPLITMKLFAEERKAGTLEMLMTKPVRDSEVVLGKFLAAFSFFFVMLASTLPYVLILTKYGNPDMGAIWTGYLGFLLLGAAFISIGLFASTLTENQIIAGVLGFSLILFLWVIGWLSGILGISSDSIFNYLSFATKIDDFFRGIIDFRSIIYYLSVTGFMLFVTIKSIEVRKWK
ncbi:ABC transporter permease [Patescibacteria group bacterium]|nr:ABC transporter permease [Patescibacteria group bacterium]